MIATEVVFHGKHTACARVVWDLTEPAETLPPHPSLEKIVI